MTAAQVALESLEGLPLRIGPYQVVGRLAKGGMAELLLGRRFGPQGFARSVAIKRILPHLVESQSFIDMFLDEARLAAAIQHPNVVSVEDLNHDDDGLYMVMEYLAGESLSGVIRRLVRSDNYIAPELAIHIIAEACGGLHAAHGLRDETGAPLHVVHRDVSPHNLFLTYDGSVKVLDFGIAQAANRLTKTETGSIKGKFSYMAPEQVQNAALDKRTDVFALGIVLYELLTLRRLFKRDNPAATLRAVLTHPIRPPSLLRPDLPRGIDVICKKALSRDASKRYQSAAEMRRDLLALRKDEGELPEERLADLMRDLFGERADAKARMLQKVREGASVSVVVGEQAYDDDDGIPAAPSASAVPVPPARATPKWLWAAGLAVAVALGAGLYVATQGSSTEDPVASNTPESTTAGPPAPTVPDTIRVTVVSVPEGATVEGDGVETVITPGTLELPRTTEQLTLRFDLAGYQPWTEEITTDESQRIRVQLVPVPTEPDETTTRMSRSTMRSSSARMNRPRPTKMAPTRMDDFQLWD